ncbi:putative bifunctional diguanylate cyclase/phosphodiesterase [Paenibacillus phyllosphaerae]|uniref:putative bifunctional diguanylate cyclase/phosphodiesterase n=1 Tax=Paenibacillus phyllosphaerae TaxID=274593 RepID=UPI001C8826B2|nr:bifunctional diguanylate cyclase/phosphodiesterase [Paenibacillus phyllosphaerae]
MTTQHLLSRIRPILAAIVLYICALLTNIYTLPLGFGLHYLFDSLFLYIALLLFGTKRAALLTIAVYMTTIFVFGNNFLYFLAILMILFTGLYRKMKVPYLLLSNLLFWLIPGWIIIAVPFYMDSGELGLSWLVFLFKYVLNTSFNSLIAEIIVFYLPLHRLAGIKGRERGQLSLNRLAFHTSMLMVVCPFMIFIFIYSIHNRNYVTQNYEMKLTTIHQNLRHDYIQWQSMEPLPNELSIPTPMKPGMQRMSELHGVRIYILDASGHIVYTTDKTEPVGQQWSKLQAGRWGKEGPSFYMWQPAKGSKLVMTNEWNESSFVYRGPLGPRELHLVIEQPTESGMIDQRKIQALTYAIVIAFIVLSAVANLLLSRYLLFMLYKLATMTKGLPERLRREKNIPWPTSPFVEMRWLVANFQTMSGELLAMFHETQVMNERLQKQTEQLHRLAHYDMLTNLPNRLHFNVDMQQLLSELRGAAASRGIAVLLLDLDRFKQVNDSMGHHAGDQLLLEVGQRLTNALPDQGIYRLGGDEFVIIVRFDEMGEVESAAGNVLEALSKPIYLHSHEIFVKTSIGIAICNDPAMTIDMVLRQADAAMYHAKEKGGHQPAVYTAMLDRKSLDRLQLEHALHHAIAHNEFMLLFQPKVSSATGAITGAEALIRWNHTERGIVPPDRFIPVAEETGQIVPIGEWVLEQAFLAMDQLHKLGYPELTIAVNLSPRQLEEPDLIEKLKAMLEKTGFPPEKLELEITEAFLIRDEDQAMQRLTTIKDMGISIAIDDFGTGYSSFGQLHRVLPDRIKIDKSFVSPMSTDAGKAAIVQSMIQMAHSLSLGVVAEGIETEEEMKLLQQMGCEEMQGYLFSRPVPLDDFAKQLTVRNGKRD